MKVKDLVEEIERCKKDYPDFMEWDVFTEQISLTQKNYEKLGKGLRFINDEEDWEYCECVGFWTKFVKEKIFTINVNY